MLTYTTKFTHRDMRVPKSYERDIKGALNGFRGEILPCKHAKEEVVPLKVLGTAKHPLY